MIELSGMDLKNSIEDAAKSGYPQVQGWNLSFNQLLDPFNLSGSFLLINYSSS